MAKSMQEIAELLKQTSFKSRFIGGVDEDDVWQKLGRLQREYEALVQAVQHQSHGALAECQNRCRMLEERLREVEKRGEHREPLRKDKTTRGARGNLMIRWRPKSAANNHWYRLTKRVARKLLSERRSSTGNLLSLMSIPIITLLHAKMQRTEQT